MTQLTFPSPYSLVLPIQVKTPGEPFSLHLDSFLLLPRERLCRFTGELPNDSLTSHLRSKWMEKESLSLPPAWHKHEESWECGHEQPPELQQPADVTGPESKLKLLWRMKHGAHYQSVKELFFSCRALGWGEGLAMADSWRHGRRLGASRCTATLCE